jgi:putative membrane protein
MQAFLFPYVTLYCMIIFIIFGILLGALAVIFALQNIIPITVTFLAWHISGSLAIVLFVALIVGVIISLLISLPEIVKNHLLFRELRKQNKTLQDEIAALRNPPAPKA